ncbi:hypothetical protein [Alkaliphilus oremlandii]|uniref:Uncharacterized protein n=1 Tax=Alkaliphilus oremlandii (strain OhILAs) TaxID=350688 RepID=A8MH62_ALKOO|nr:hypothetical protein [Alkaliphilus oremlandii]ABW18949.1 hypothetical protein Clos_1405 [Alkaliphilus oremlandii OhILAs]
MMDMLISTMMVLFIVASMGYIFTILKEKLYLNNNMIILDHKGLNQEDLKNLDIKHFMLGGIELMAGDEVKIMLEDENKLIGTIIGANKSNNIIAIITKDRDVARLNIQSIKKLKVISRYGKFFTKF